VGTSGDYQQFYELDGKRYHHILNAKTGLPVENVFSVTVISPQAAWADGLSTALFTLSPEQAIDIVGEMNDTNCVIYYEQEGSIVSLKSEGIRQFEFSEKI
jgi:thiamine biosynthesis lipoprotein